MFYTFLYPVLLHNRISLPLKLLIYPFIFCIPAAILYPVTSEIDNFPKYRYLADLNTYIPLIAHTIILLAVYC